MFELHRSGGVSLRYYDDRFGVLGDRSGRRVGLLGDLLRVVREVEQAVGLEKVLLLARLEECDPRFAAVQRVLSSLLERLGRQRPTTYARLLGEMPEFYQLTFERRHPLFAMIELTYRCNLRCHHCYILHKLQRPTPETMDEEEAEAFLESLAELGCLDVTLTGGESTLHPAWRRLLRRSKDLGFYTMLKTNGLTFTPKNVERYAEDPAHSTHLSLYGATADVHERITRRSTSFAKTLTALRELARAGIPCKVFCLVWRGNVGQVEEMRDLVRELGHSPVLSSTMYGRMDGDLSPLALKISPSENRGLVARGLVPPFEVAPCTAARTKIKIEPGGRLAVCELLGRTFGPVRGARLAEAWNDPELTGFGEDMVSISRSDDQGKAPLPSCPGINLLNTGRYTGPTRFET